MRGPHNILRLIRTGATLERTGAMPVILNALDGMLKAEASTEKDSMSQDRSC